ncbi:hypothetical protein BKA65DRAFT_591113 [Rhexocercosporidium sp. MPI-PUGE-AT-0058]|nr:hypothetical protein BKA65DRAFT_591113 [Rhexocercosporidium sp. MPI-PUGE-AT-0058]
MASDISRTMSSRPIEQGCQKPPPMNEYSTSSFSPVSRGKLLNTVKVPENIKEAQSCFRTSTSTNYASDKTRNPNETQGVPSGDQLLTPENASQRGSESFYFPGLRPATPSTPMDTAIQPSASAAEGAIPPSKKRGRPRKGSDVTTKAKYTKRKPQDPDAPPPSKKAKVASKAEILEQLSNALVEKRKIQKRHNSVLKENNKLKVISMLLGRGREVVPCHKLEEAEDRNAKLWQQNCDLRSLLWEHGIKEAGTKNRTDWHYSGENTSFDEV